MASLPSQASRRRSTHSDQASLSSAEQPSSSMPSRPEEILEPLELNSPALTASQTVSQHSTTTGQHSSQTAREIRRCWICQQEDTDDTPENSVWRTPCPCSLTAHDSCLLEWIANKEAPKPGEIASTQQIVCPQCQAKINVERPRDFLVLATDKIQRVVKIMILPSALSAILGCFYSGFMVYGVNTLNIVFGPEEAASILAPTLSDIETIYQIRTRPTSRMLSRLVKSMDPFLPGTDFFTNWRLFVGLPLIAPALVLSRTRVADQAFAILPITYFLFRPENRDLRQWPPSPALTIAVLPYIRTAYNELYRHTFSDLEKKWDKAVQRKPREGETEEQVAAGQQEEQREGQAILDFELEFIEVEEEREEPPPPAARPAPVHGAAGNANADAPAVEANGDQAAQAPPQQPARRRDRNWEIHQNVSTASVISTVMGALFFPAISSVMGDMLKHTLPRTWVTKQGESLGLRVDIRTGDGPKGFLQEKWGRTILGGCLFVVLKDVVTLYCKWRKAQDFGKRKIVDYIGERKGKV